MRHIRDDPVVWQLWHHSYSGVKGLKIWVNRDTTEHGIPPKHRNYQFRSLMLWSSSRSRGIRRSSARYSIYLEGVDQVYLARIQYPGLHSISEKKRRSRPTFHCECHVNDIRNVMLVQQTFVVLKVTSDLLTGTIEKLK